MSILKRRPKGQTAVIMIIALPALIGALALTCDVAVMYATWFNLQKGADAAALAGANSLPDQPTTAVAGAQRYANANGIASSEIFANQVSPSNQSLTFTAQRTVPHLFGRVVGLFNAPIRVTAIAGIKPAGPIKGVIPIGVYCGGTATPCDLTTGRVGPGNWSFVQLDGPGANLLGNGIVHGSSTWHQSGDSVNMQTGCDNGAAKQMQTRLDNATAFEAQYPISGGASATNHWAGDPRAVEAPIMGTDPSTLTGSSSPSTILGFVGFWISGNDCSSISGVVISDVTTTARPSGAPGTCTTGPCTSVLVPVAY